MKPLLLKAAAGPGHSFLIRRDMGPAADDCWHIHEEIELVHVKKGSGTLFVGDKEEKFHSGDVVLIGAGLPHCRKFEGADIDCRVIHFREKFLGCVFMELPENFLLKGLLDRARRGLQVEGKAREKVAGPLERLLAAEGMPRLLLLLEALHVLAASDQLHPLASIGFKHNVRDLEHERVNLIYEYSLRHFRRPIQLEEIAAVAGISPNSFCRFFKSRTRKTYSRFLIEVRVGHACKLLIANNLSIKQLCFESGFNNFTSFYKYFKLITGKSPLGYQREFMSGLSGGEMKSGRRA